jgi:hypothetical protein
MTLATAIKAAISRELIKRKHAVLAREHNAIMHSLTPAIELALNDMLASRERELCHQLLAVLRKEDPAITRAYRLRCDFEETTSPLYLLVVTPTTSPSGVVPICYGADETFPRAYILIEVTPEEYDADTFKLPKGWRERYELTL